MPIQPNLLERVAFQNLNLAPGIMLDVAGAMAYQAVSTAVQLQLFNGLADGPSTPAELAVRLDAQERGLAPLLGALAAIGYVDEKDGRYANSKMTQKWLLDNDALDIDSLLTYWDAAFRDLWHYAPEVIRSGERPCDFYSWLESTPGLAHSFQQALIVPAYDVGPDIAKKLALPDGPTRLLDVGGGHGMYSVVICQAYPELQATILDSRSALVTASTNVAKHNLSGRITLQEGDLWAVDWGQDYDAILLFNMVHHFDGETNLKLLKKTAAALKPGGKAAILDQIEGRVSGSAANAFIRLLALQLYVFADGRIHSHEDMEAALTKAGLKDIQSHKLTKLPGTSLMIAAKG
jgi:SAM-dependent methyltransferase